jgi:hypothetical protein
MKRLPRLLNSTCRGTIVVQEPRPNNRRPGALPWRTVPGAGGSTSWGRRRAIRSWMPGSMLWRAGRFVDATLDLEQGLGAESALCATLAIAPYGRARMPLRTRLCCLLAAAEARRRATAGTGSSCCSASRS